jgi:hypothetical protein
MRCDFERLSRDGGCELRYANLLNCGGERASPHPRKVFALKVDRSSLEMDYISRR